MTLDHLASRALASMRGRRIMDRENHPGEIIGERQPRPYDAPQPLEKVAAEMHGGALRDHLRQSTSRFADAVERATDRGASDIAQSVPMKPTPDEMIETAIRERVMVEVSRERSRVVAEERGVSALSPRERELLNLLIEECAELQKTATKTLRHGWGSYNPDGNRDVSNGDMMQHEHVDLMTVLNKLMLSGRLKPVGPSEIQSCWKRKLRYLHHQEV